MPEFITETFVKGGCNKTMVCCLVTDTSLKAYFLILDLGLSVLSLLVSVSITVS